jgi:hypothetical protein
MKLILYSIGLTAVLLVSFAATVTVLAQTSVLAFIVSNTIGATQTSLQVPANVSSITLIDGAYTDGEALDSDVTTGDVSIGYMPGTDRVRMLACFDDLAADATTECNDDTTNDIILPAADTEVFEFAADNQFRTLWLNISQPAVANWVIEWQYYDGTSYVAFDSISDGTANFTFPGLRRVTWGFPPANAWPAATLHSIEGYWVRAEVVEFTSLTQVPLARQAWYETGRWWSLAANLGPTTQQEFQIEFGHTPDPKDFHYYFPHADGVVVPDAATIEVTGSSVKIWRGWFDMTAPLTGSGKKIAFKEDSMEITIPSEGVIQGEVFVNP